MFIYEELELCSEKCAVAKRNSLSNDSTIYIFQN